MNTFQWLWKVTRPAAFVSAGLASWTMAILCNGPDMFSSNTLAAGIVMALNCLGASIFHYGAANKMYARKVWDIVPTTSPWALVAIGTLLFIGSLLGAWLYLPRPCLWIVACNICILILYARPLSKTWWTKNWSMAYVCVTPLLMGWLSGTHQTPILPYMTTSIFCLYWSKEIIKDVHDIRANCGIRVTLPIRFGIPQALRVGGILASTGTALATTIFFITEVSFMSALAIIPAICLFAYTSWRLLTEENPGKTNELITAGSYCLIAGVLTSKANFF